MAQVRQPSSSRLHRAAWPDMFANLHTAYAELTNTQFELERRTAQIEETRDLFELVLESMSDALFLMDLTGRIKQTNSAAQALLGYHEAELAGASLAEVCGTTEIPATAAELLRESRDGVLRDLEVEVTTRAGISIPVNVSCGLVRDKRGKIVGTLVVERDITERKRAEAAIRRLNDDLQRRADELVAANKELEAFSYSVSHDLRAPLRALDGFSRIVLRDYAADLPAQAQHYLNLVRENTQRMGALIDDLLAFSRLSRQPLSRQRVDMVELVREVIDELEADMQERRIEFSIGQLPPGWADPRLLRQVYANLVANAMKFTRDRETAIIDVGWRREGDESIYYVQDNGVGFDMRYADKLFGVFQRLHRAEEFEGTGVGLAIVHRIIHRHGGRVWACAEEGRGAIFSFTLG